MVGLAAHGTPWAHHAEGADFQPGNNIFFILGPSYSTMAGSKQKWTCSQLRFKENGGEGDKPHDMSNHRYELRRSMCVLNKALELLTADVNGARGWTTEGKPYTFFKSDGTIVGVTTGIDDNSGEIAYYLQRWPRFARNLETYCVPHLTVLANSDNMHATMYKHRRREPPKICPPSYHIDMQVDNLWARSVMQSVSFTEPRRSWRREFAKVLRIIRATFMHLQLKGHMQRAYTEVTGRELEASHIQANGDWPKEELVPLPRPDERDRSIVSTSKQAAAAANARNAMVNATEEERSRAAADAAERARRQADEARRQAAVEVKSQPAEEERGRPSRRPRREERQEAPRGRSSKRPRTRNGGGGVPQRFLVLKCLSPVLAAHPIHVPIPAAVETTDAEGMAKFVRQAYGGFMRMKHFAWTHQLKDVVVQGVRVRRGGGTTLVFPSIALK